MITGDHPDTAATIGKWIGIDTVEVSCFMRRYKSPFAALYIGISPSPPPLSSPLV